MRNRAEANEANVSLWIPYVTSFMVHYRQPPSTVKLPSRLEQCIVPNSTHAIAKNYTLTITILDIIHLPWRRIMPRIVIVKLIYHRHKPIDSINLLGSQRRHVFLVRYGQTYKLSRVLNRRQDTQFPGVQLGHYVPRGYKYGNLALQIGGVSDETVKYGYGFCATRTIKLLHCKLQTRPVLREGTSQKKDRKFPTGSNIWS
jgi:hypothetical protein